MKLLLSVMLLVLLSHNGKCYSTTDSLLSVLKSEILKKNVYDSQKNHRIKLLKQELSAMSKSNFSAQYTICNKIYEEYKEYKFDSAYVYTHKLLYFATLMQNLPKQYDTRIKLGAIQRSLGMLKEAFECINQIDAKKLPDSIKIDYYELQSLTLKDQAIYNTDEFYSRPNRQKSVEAMSRALHLAAPGSYEQHKHTAQTFIAAGQNAKAAEHYRMLLRQSKLTLNQRAMAAFDLSGLVNGAEKITLLAQAAIYDVRSSNKETLATLTLGLLLFKQGNLDDAEFLLKEALAKARFFGNRLSERELIANLTQVSAQKLINSENKKTQILTVLITFVGISLVAIAVFSFNVYSRLKKVKIREAIVQEQNQHLDIINKKLSEDAQIKEEYIGYFFDIISGYILKLEKLKMSNIRHIKARNYEELLQLANSIDIKQERETLFYTFDTIFLKLFPDFITTFNSLLKPEDQIWPKANEVLNTHLRIYALKRLGISDNQTIANILESAVSTIYKYKLRIKSKALVRGDDFERKIMGIDSQHGII